MLLKNSLSGGGGIITPCGSLIYCDLAPCLGYTNRDFVFLTLTLDYEGNFYIGLNSVSNYQTKYLLSCNNMQGNIRWLTKLFDNGGIDRTENCQIVSLLVLGDKLYATVSRLVQGSVRCFISLCCLSKDTGELIYEKAYNFGDSWDNCNEGLYYYGNSTSDTGYLFYVGVENTYRSIFIHNASTGELVSNTRFNITQAWFNHTSFSASTNLFWGVLNTGILIRHELNSAVATRFQLPTTNCKVICCNDSVFLLYDNNKICKLDTDGNVVWTKLFPVNATSITTDGVSIYLSVSNRYYVLNTDGQVTSIIKFMPNNLATIKDGKLACLNLQADSSFYVLNVSLDSVLKCKNFKSDLGDFTFNSVNNVALWDLPDSTTKVTRLGDISMIKGGTPVAMTKMTITPNCSVANCNIETEYFCSN